MSTPSYKPRPNPPYRIAVIDNWLSIAPPYYSHLDPSIFEKPVFFSETLSATQDLGKLIQRLEPFHIIVSTRERTAFPRELLEKLPKLLLLLNSAPRNKSIDYEAAKELGIAVGGTSGVGQGDPDHPLHDASKPVVGGRVVELPAGAVDPTAQCTLALMLDLAGRVTSNDRTVKRGGWQTNTVTGLPGKTLGVLGFGRIGRLVARAASLAFGMKILAWSANLTAEEADQRAKESGIANVELAASKADLFSRADFLTVHYQLSERSEGMVGEAELAKMKPTAFFINTSRGNLVDESALLDVLRAGKIAGAGLDVFWEEPLPVDSVWRREEWGGDGKSDVVLSPHVGFVEETVMKRWSEEQVDKMQKWARNEKFSFQAV